MDRAVNSREEVESAVIVKIAWNQPVVTVRKALEHDASLKRTVAVPGIKSNLIDVITSALFVILLDEIDFPVAGEVSYRNPTTTSAAARSRNRSLKAPAAIAQYDHDPGFTPAQQDKILTAILVKIRGIEIAQCVGACVNDGLRE